MPDYSDLLDAYDNYCKAASMSPGTRALKQKYLQRFAADHDLMTCTSQDISDWMSDKPWAPATMRSARSAMTTFFFWARKMGHRPDDPAIDTARVKVPSAAPKPCPESVLARALEQAAPRERLAILLGAYAGLRRAEIAGLHADMIDMESRTIRVKGKGGKLRVVPVADALVEPLTEAVARGGYLFPGQGGHAMSPEHLARLVKAHLGPNLSTHTLRHRFATQVYAKTHNLRAVQGLLGHESIATTERYTAVTDAERRDAVAALAAM